MVNKCDAFGCSNGNNSQRKDEDAAKLSTFYFPKNKPGAGYSKITYEKALRAVKST